MRRQKVAQIAKFPIFGQLLHDTPHVPPWRQGLNAGKYIAKADGRTSKAYEAPPHRS